MAQYSMQKFGLGKEPAVVGPRYPRSRPSIPGIPGAASGLQAVSAQVEARGEGFISELLSLKYPVVLEPAIPQAGDLYDAFDPNIAAALDGVESPVAALHAVAEDWKQLLAGS